MRKKMSSDELCDALLKKMFWMMDMKYPDKSFTADSHWFQKRAWTKAEEDEFFEWARLFLKKNSGWNMRRIDHELPWFRLMWGWKNTEHECDSNVRHHCRGGVEPRKRKGRLRAAPDNAGVSG